MDDTIEYLNTDLDLISGDDPTLIVAALEARGVSSLFVTRGGDGSWYATFETDEQQDEPESNFEAIVIAIESFEASARVAWDDCIRRELNIGYACGSKPWAFNQGISSALLARVAAAGMAFRVTIYPTAEDKAATPRHSHR